MPLLISRGEDGTGAPGSALVFWCSEWYLWDPFYPAPKESILFTYTFAVKQS